MLLHALVLVCIPQALHASGDEVRVLMLYGVDPYLPPFLALDKAMREDLVRKSDKHVVVFSESLDSQRFALETLEPYIAPVLATKYKAMNIDVVVAVSRSALDFFVRHGAQIWPGARVVYVGFLGHEFQPSALPPGGSAVLSVLDAAGTIEIAHKMQPGARRVVVISGASEIDRRGEQQARVALTKLDMHVPVEFLSGLPLPSLLLRVAAEPPDTIVIYLSQFRDADGKPYEPFEVLSAVIATSHAPVYGAAEPYIGLGVVAGSVSSYVTKGRLVGEQVLRAMSREPADTGHIVLETPNRCVADARALQRRGLDPSRLPVGCEIRFAEVSLWRQYWWQIALALLIMVTQGLLIAGLLSQRRWRRLAERAELEQRAKLFHASRLALAGELTGAIAHEINQPLGAILSNADAGDLLLDSGIDQREKLRAILADIRRDDLRASDVIQRLRKLLRKQEVDREQFDFNDVMTDTQSILLAESRRRGVVLELQAAAEPLPVLADRVQIQQVLINLVLNAMDAVAEQPEARRTVTVSLSKKDRLVVLAVRDKGHGIAPENRQKIFESFFTTKSTGMGLGLSIANTIMEAHGGHIRVEGVAGDGTIFKAELPLATAADARLPDPA